ncbi:MAG: hypothetical protein U0414_17230 [Polyangiaceae bacterium]
MTGASVAQPRASMWPNAARSAIVAITVARVPGLEALTWLARSASATSTDTRPPAPERARRRTSAALGSATSRFTVAFSTRSAWSAAFIATLGAMAHE